MRPLALLSLAIVLPLRLAAQAARAPVSPFSMAVRRGTRTATGRPGPRYWQQYAAYRITARLDPGTRSITGEEAVRYFNHSPDTLVQLVMELYQNLHTASGAYRTGWAVTGGIDLRRVSVHGMELHEVRGSSHAPGYYVHNTLGAITLPHPLAPGDSLDLGFEWRFTMPMGDPRMGTDDDVWMAGYWYPQIAVYDDVDGWHTAPYTGRAEFYMGYADYDVTLDVPSGWLVGATGVLANAREVLDDSVLARLKTVAPGGGVVHVVTEAQRSAGGATRAGTRGRLAWHFTSERTRDFAWATSEHYLWDQVATAIPQETGAIDTVRVSALYRRSAPAWPMAAAWGARTLAFYSGFLWPYPWPQLTLVEGPWGGMEYPMLSVLWPYRDSLSLYAVSAHEIGHMWFPMQVGSNERSSPWMDEGLTQYDGDQAVRALLGASVDLAAGDMDEYLRVARGKLEQPIVTHGDALGNEAYGAAAYFKPVAMLRALRAILGDSAFLAAYREYGRRWRWRHPSPVDFIATFTTVSGEDLQWFWREWLDGTEVHDVVLKRVRPVGDSLEVVIENRGHLLLPTPVEIVRSDSSRTRTTIAVDQWLHGTEDVTLRFANTPAIVEVALDPDRVFPAIHRPEQHWPFR